jgi:hypothetical protein
MVGVVPADEAEAIPVGMIPDDGTQTTDWATKANGTTTLRTVTAGKTLYMSAATLFARNSAATAEQGQLAIYTDGDVFQHALIYFDLLTDTQQSLSLNMIPPVEVQAGYKVKIYSSDAAMHVTGFTHGYEL